MSEKSETALPEVVGLLKEMIHRQDATNQRLDDTIAAVKVLAEDTNAGFKTLAGEIRATNQHLDATSQRLDSLTLEVRGMRADLKKLGDVADLAERLAKVEAVVFKPTGT